jgi:excisionase family DNA binding protein
VLISAIAVLRLKGRRILLQSYLTPEEIAQQLKFEATDIMSLIEQGKLRAIRVGDNIRVPEPEPEKLLVTSAAVQTLTDLPASRFAQMTTAARNQYPHAELLKR